MINTFGVTKSKEKISEKVSFNLKIKQSKVFQDNAFCTDVICLPQTNQLIDYLRDKFEHLTGLNFADDGPYVIKNIDLLMKLKIKIENKGERVGFF